MDSNRAWKNCVARLKKETTADEFTQWIKPLRAKFDGNRVTIYAHNEVVENQVRGRYLAHIRSYLKTETNGVDIGSIRLAISKRVGGRTPQPKPVPPRSKILTGLRKELLLRNFVVGSSNEEAFRAAQTVASRPGSTDWNPLFVYGDVGLGKSHLLHAVGNEILLNAPETRVLYLYTMNFVSDVVSAIRNNSTNGYLEELEKCDVLIMDDVQFFSGKKKCMEEFLHVFNRFESRGTQMVFGSSKHPDDIEGLDPSLKSRFRSRLAIQVQPLNIETRAQMLSFWALNADPRWILSEENALYIAENVRGDARNLASFWARLTLPTGSERRHVSRRLIEKTLRSGYTVRRTITVSQIQGVAAEHYGISLERLLSSSRRADVVRCRHMAMFITKQLTQLPLLSIARRFNRKDHTTVKHACNSMREDMAQNYDTQADYEEIINKISE